MGRAKLWEENINLTLPKGAKARIDAVRQEGEDRLDVIRTAIDKEVERRERIAPPKKPSTARKKPSRGS